MHEVEAFNRERQGEKLQDRKLPLKLSYGEGDPESISGRAGTKLRK